MNAIIGTAGWSIPSTDASRFAQDGTALERYSLRFNGVEVNSSFYRSHRPSTWQRWAASVPADFRFAVKVPRAITHHAKLIGTEALISQFAEEVGQLGPKLGVLLAQLPPKLAFDVRSVERFFTRLRESLNVGLVCEPRNQSWFTDVAETTLEQLQVGRVAADPALSAAAATPGGWQGLAYWRLHGSPAIYRSCYSDAALGTYAALIRAKSIETHGVWCMFDNTAASAATANALSLKEML